MGRGSLLAYVQHKNLEAAHQTPYISQDKEDDIQHTVGNPSKYPRCNDVIECWMPLQLLGNEQCDQEDRAKDLAANKLEDDPCCDDCFGVGTEMYASL